MPANHARRWDNYKLLISKTGNGTYEATIVANKHNEDDLGALYYVVAVIFIYGFSIVLMIASHIRKNKVDRKLSNYLKEMANVRKRERQLQLFNAAARASLAHIMTKQDLAEANARYSRRFNFQFPPERTASLSSETADDTDVEQTTFTRHESRRSANEGECSKAPLARKPSRIRFSTPLAQIEDDSPAHDSITETEQGTKETDCLISGSSQPSASSDCTDHCYKNEQGDDHPWVENSGLSERTSPDSDSVFESEDLIQLRSEEDNSGSKKDSGNSQLQLISCL